MDDEEDKDEDDDVAAAAERSPILERSIFAGSISYRLGALSAYIWESEGDSISFRKSVPAVFM